MKLEIGLIDIKRIIEALNESTGIDFNNYAFSSFRRRIERFIEVNKIPEISILIEKIKSDLSYANKLVNDITVNVTEMFRDPSFWAELRNSVLPQIARDKNEINIWHAACSTGEEVFSMAILLKESNLLHRSNILATDLNLDVLKIAEKGIYQLRNQEANSKNYLSSHGKNKLSDYYTLSNNLVQYDTQLLEKVEFRGLNLVEETANSSFDLILCRNVLIYFNFNLQEIVIQNFALSMPAGSFLGIGSKESINWCKASRYFKSENNEEKIYRKIAENGQNHYINGLNRSR